MKSLKDLIVDECRQDIVGITDLMGIVWHYNPDANDDWVRDKVIQLIEEILVEDLAKAGGFPDGSREFTPWEISALEVVQKVRNEWLALGRRPHLGELIYLYSGDQYIAGDPDKISNG